MAIYGGGVVGQLPYLHVWIPNWTIFWCIAPYCGGIFGLLNGLRTKDIRALKHEKMNKTFNAMIDI